MWLAIRDGALQLELRPQRFTASFKPGGNTRLQLALEPGQLRVELKHLPWEGYFHSRSSGSELGLRFKQAWARDKWLFLSRGALQRKGGLTLLELGQAAGYQLTPWCTIYAEGVFGLLPSASWRADVGVIQMCIRDRCSAMSGSRLWRVRGSSVFEAVLWTSVRLQWTSRYD